MTSKGNNYKIWIENLEKQTDEAELKAEKYARYLKQKQYQEVGNTTAAIKMNVNNVLKGISKYKSLKGEEPTKVSPSAHESCRLDY